MIEQLIPIAAVPKGRMLAVLEEQAIRTNEYAKAYLSHPLVAPDPGTDRARVVIAPLGELGFEDGATWPELLRKIPETGLRLCRPAIGFYLRLAWMDQRMSADAVLTGRRRSPDGAVTVLSAPLENGDAFPKGLYLRNVDGVLWLRGFVCDASYLWSADDLFALEK